MQVEAEVHWPEALVSLIDALEAFIEVDQTMGVNLLCDRKITQEDFARGMKQVREMERMLARLKKIEPDRTLDGIIPIR